jgi:hypothetical protein
VYGNSCLKWFSLSLSPGSRGRVSASLTWLFNHIQDGLSTGIFIVLEPDNTVILILVGTIHCILASVLWDEGGENRRMKNRSIPRRWGLSQPLS